LEIYCTVNFLFQATNFCATVTETDKEVYRDFTAGTVIAFMAGKLNLLNL